MMKKLAILLSLLVSACSNLPKNITEAPIRDIQLAEVRNNTAIFSGNAVRWGGIIVKVDNHENSTGIQVLSYPLGHYGQPLLQRGETGRFYLKTTDFLDPVIYAQGIEITVYGIVNGEINKQVGDKSLTLPVVDSQNIHLWQNYRRKQYPYSYYWPHSYGFYARYPYGFYHHGFYPGYRRYYGYPVCY